MRSLREHAPALPNHPPSCWVLVLDADRTLAPIDTGREIGRDFDVNGRIRALFESEGYATSSFRQHAAVWTAIPTEPFLVACQRVAAQIQLHDTWRQLLHRDLGIPTVVVTAGIPQVWRQVLSQEGFGHVPVFGGVHQELDPHFVSPDCKAWLVRKLQSAGRRVVAAGDSEIDLPMLKAADVPLWVPGPKGSPRLRARLHEVPNIQQVLIDERRFPPLPTINTRTLKALLQGDPHGPRPL